MVFMDCQLPKIDGYETTARIRSRKGTASHLWIVAMTASVMQGARERCVSAGMDDYLAKPVTGRSVREALDRFHRNAVNESKSRSVIRRGCGQPCAAALGQAHDEVEARAEAAEIHADRAADRLDEI